mgnify:CR=1 FL=1
MEKKKLSRKEYLDSLDPDNLNLEKKDLINFCHSCIDEWQKNKISNFKYILSMQLMIGCILNSLAYLFHVPHDGVMTPPGRE